MTTYLVNTIADTLVPHAAGSLSLRGAIAAANTGDRAATIQFAPCLHGQTIVLTEGALVIQTHLTIEGLGADRLRLVRHEHAPDFRLMTVKCSSDFGLFTNVKIYGLTLVGGVSAEGSGIYNDGASLTLSNCCLREHATHQLYDKGGALYNHRGQVHLYATRITHNCAGLGGGIYNEEGQVWLYKSRLSDNQAAYGGGLYNYGEQAEIVAFASSFWDNTAYLGDNFRNLRGSITLEDSLLSDYQGISAIGNHRPTPAVVRAA